MYKKLFLLVLTLLIPTFSLAQATQEKQEDVFSIAVSVNQAIIDHNARNVDIFYQVESRDREYSDLRVGVEFLNINDLNAPALYTYFPNQSVTLSPRVPKENIINLVVPEFLVGKVTPRLVVYGQNDFLVAFRDMGIITLPASTYKKVTIQSCLAENKKVTCVLSRKLQDGEATTLILKQGGRSGSIAEVQKTTNAQSTTLVFNFTKELGATPNPLLEAFVSTGDTKLSEAYFPITGKIIYQSVINVFSGEKREGDVRFSVLATKNYASENETLKVTLYDPSNKVCDSQEKPFTESIQTFSFAGHVKCNAVRALATISYGGKVVSARQVYTSDLFVFEGEKSLESTITNNYFNTKNMTLLILILVALALVVVRGRKVVAVFALFCICFLGNTNIVLASTHPVTSNYLLQAFYSPFLKATIYGNCSANVTINDPVAPSGNGIWSATGNCTLSGVPANRSIRSSNLPMLAVDQGAVRCSGGGSGTFSCSGGGTFTAASSPGTYQTPMQFSPPAGSQFNIQIFDQDNQLLETESVVAGGTKPGWRYDYIVANSVICGDGIREGSEQCDDGNSSNSDSCTNLCRTAICGDSIRRYTPAVFAEECDAGPLNGPSPRACSTSCELNPTSGPVCGDGIVNQASEQCDGTPVQCSSTNQQCNSSCQLVSCNPNEFACSLSPSPNQADVGSNVTLTPQSVSTMTWGTWQSCDINTTPNDSGEVNFVSNGWGLQSLQSLPLLSGLQTFQARCTGQDQFYDLHTVMCSPATVTGGSSPQGYRCGACSTVGVSCAVGELNCYADTDSCNTSCAATAINIGWTPAPVFDPQAKTVELGQGDTTTSQTLYVTTGGRTNCALTGTWSSGGGNVRIEPVQYSSYAVNVGLGNYSYTLACQDSSKPASLTVNAYSGSVTRYQCSPAGSTGPCTQTTCAANDAGCIGSTYSDATSCEAATSCDAVDVCSTGVCSAQCPQNCTTDAAECVGGQATITSPANGRVLSGQNFTVNFRFRNVGNTLWSTPTYRVNTISSTFPASWRAAFGTQVLSPSPIAGSLGGYGYTNPYSKTFTAPTVSAETTFTLGFTLEKNGVPFNTQCLVNGTGEVVVSLPECSDGIDNDSDGKIDCQPGNEDPGCYPDGNGGGGSCNPNDDDETDNTGSDMSITANPQLVRSGGTSNVTFTCDAGTWKLTGPQVNNIKGVGRDTSATKDSGCDLPNVFCGTEALTDKVFPAQNVTSKEIYTLRCGGKERSATISVIKINEV